MSFADLKGRTAIVTGAARGIGFAIAEELARGSADIVVIDLKKEDADAAAGRIAEAGVKSKGVAANVANAEDVKRAVEESFQLSGKVDILVNNAGITRDGLLMKMTDDQWQSVIDVNLKSVFLMTREVIRPMMKARYGRIVSIASVVGLMGNAGQCNYAASKAGIIGFTKSIAKEYASKNVTANAVAPGFIQSEMTAKLSQEVIDKMKALIPLGALGEPRHVADAVRFLASESAAYVSGQVLTVDGGMVM